MRTFFDLKWVPPVLFLLSTISGFAQLRLVDYHAATGKWTNTRPIDSAQGIFVDEMGQSDSRSSYPNIL